MLLSSCGLSELQNGLAPGATSGRQINKRLRPALRVACEAGQEVFDDGFGLMFATLEFRDVRQLRLDVDAAA